MAMILLKPILQVAPHGGAWIETEQLIKILLEKIVAPHGGAWIETLGVVEVRAKDTVAPHGGAWIETICS